MSGQWEPPDKPDLYVVARFLHALFHEPGSHTLTSLQMASRLNYGRFRAYLAFLEERGFVQIIPKAKQSDRVVLTAGGREAYRDLVGWIEEVIGHTFG